MFTNQRWKVCALTGGVLLAVVAVLVGELDASQGQKRQRNQQKQQYQLECQTIFLEHANCEQAASRLRRLFERGEGKLQKISCYEPTNVLLLRAIPEEIEQIKFLIAKVDIPQKTRVQRQLIPRRFQVIAVQQADAGSLARLLHSMMMDMDAQPNQHQARSPRFDVDERTNVIVVYGTDSQIKHAQELISALDVSVD